MNNRIENRKKERLENIRTGYEVANNLWIMSDQNYWAIFNALLVANTILLGSIGWFFSNNECNKDPFLSCLSFLIIPIVGFLVCILWFFISHRRSVYCRHYMHSARKLEEYLPPLRTMTDGGKFSRGQKVSFVFQNGERKTEKMLWSKINVAWYSYMIVGLFGLIYLIIFVSKGLDILNKNINIGELEMNELKIVIVILVLIISAMGPAMIIFSLVKLRKNNSEIESGNFKFIASLGTIITIITILAFFIGLGVYCANKKQSNDTHNTIIDTGFAYFANGGNIASGESAKAEAVFFELKSHDEYFELKYDLS